jgi:hypothetical protein
MSKFFDAASSDRRRGYQRMSLFAGAKALTTGWLRKKPPVNAVDMQPLMNVEVVRNGITFFLGAAMYIDESRFRTSGELGFVFSYAIKIYVPMKDLPSAFVKQFTKAD